MSFLICKPLNILSRLYSVMKSFEQENECLIIANVHWMSWADAWWFSLTGLSDFVWARAMIPNNPGVRRCLKVLKPGQDMSAKSLSLSLDNKLWVVWWKYRSKDLSGGKNWQLQLTFTVSSYAVTGRPPSGIKLLVVVMDIINKSIFSIIFKDLF